MTAKITRADAAHTISAATAEAITFGSEPGPARAERDAAVHDLDSGADPAEVLRLWRDGWYAPQQQACDCCTAFPEAHHTRQPCIECGHTRAEASS